MYIIEKIHFLFLIPQKTKIKIYHVYYEILTPLVIQIAPLSKEQSQIILLLPIMNSTQHLQIILT